MQRYGRPVAGKGDKYRRVHAETYGNNFDAIFRVGRSSTVEQPALTRQVVGPSPTAPANYVDDATGQVVDETWWPDATSTGRPPIQP